MDHDAHSSPLMAVSHHNSHSPHTHDYNHNHNHTDHNHVHSHPHPRPSSRSATTSSSIPSTSRTSTLSPPTRSISISISHISGATRETATPRSQDLPFPFPANVNITSSPQQQQSQSQQVQHDSRFFHGHSPLRNTETTTSPTEVSSAAAAAAANSALLSGSPQAKPSSYSHSHSQSTSGLSHKTSTSSLYQYQPPHVNSLPLPPVSQGQPSSFTPGHQCRNSRSNYVPPPPRGHRASFAYSDISSSLPKQQLSGSPETSTGSSLQFHKKNYSTASLPRNYNYHQHSHHENTMGVHSHSHSVGPESGAGYLRHAAEIFAMDMNKAESPFDDDDHEDEQEIIKRQRNSLFKGYAAEHRARSVSRNQDREGRSREGSRVRGPRQVSRGESPFGYGNSHSRDHSHDRGHTYSHSHSHDHHDHDHNHERKHSVSCSHGHDHSHSRDHHHHHSHSYDDGHKSVFTQFLISCTASYPFLYSILAEKNSRRIFYYMLLNVSFMIVQGFYGYVTNSLGLVSDTVHMFFDCMALFVGLVASILGKRPPSQRFPYGLGKIETLSGFANGILLVLLSIEITFEAFERMWEGTKTQRLGELLTVSILGMIVNLVGMAAFGHHHGHDHGHDHGHGHGHDNENMQGIYLHVLADTLGSASVVVSTILTYFTGQSFWDQLASVFISVLILASSKPLIFSAARRLLLSIPDDTEYNLRNTLSGIMQQRGVIAYSAPKFWIDDREESGERLLGVVHVVAGRSANMEDVKERVREYLLRHNMDIIVQVEREGDGNCWCGIGRNMGVSVK